MTINRDDFAHCTPLYPVLHKRRYPFAPSIAVPEGFTERVRRIEELDSDLTRLVIPKSELLRLTSEAFSSNIHHSSKIEGNPLSLEEVDRITKDSFAGVDPKASGSHEKEVINHLTALLDPSCFTGPMTLERIRGLHRILMSGVQPSAHPGSFRTGHMSVTSDSGFQTFRACGPDSIEQELQSLLDWLNRMAPAYNPIVAATVFFHEFESIHPFEDGNGRTGRVLFHGYLQTHGLDNVNACKVEALLLDDPELYYRVLGWADQTGQYSELIDYVAQALLGSYREAVDTFRAKDIIHSGLNETTRRIITKARENPKWFSVKEATGWVGTASDQTIRNHLNALVTKGILESRGLTRSRRYRFSASLRMALEFVRYFTRGHVPDQADSLVAIPAGALAEPRAPASVPTARVSQT